MAEIFTDGGGSTAAEKRERCLDYVLTEMEKAETERSGKLDRWQEWRRIRIAEPKKGKKNKPFPNASNVSVPMTSVKIGRASCRERV